VDTVNLGRTCKIYVDAGHGGHDSGATSGGLVEKDLNLDVSLALEAMLLARGHEVRMSRHSSTYPSLWARGSASARWPADLFLSIHHNAFDGHARGVECFAASERYRNGMDLALSTAKELAAELELPFHGRPAKRHTVNLGVFRHCDNAVKVTATLVECLFIDNEADRAVALRPGYAERAAAAIAVGIDKHLGIHESNVGEPRTVLVIRHGTEDVLVELDVVPRGVHMELDPTPKIFVSGIRTGDDLTGNTI